MSKIYDDYLYRKHTEVLERVLGYLTSGIHPALFLKYHLLEMIAAGTVDRDSLCTITRIVEILEQEINEAQESLDDLRASVVTIKNIHKSIQP